MADHFLDATKKADCISRETAITHIKEKQCKGCSDIGLCGNCAVLIALKLLKNVPAADVRPVVLCRDCVYYNTTGCADGFGWCEGVMVSKGTSDDFFCAEGKQNSYECGADMRPYKDGRRKNREQTSDQR